LYVAIIWERGRGGDERVIVDSWGEAEMKV
jgi:hypothetical protein